MNYIIEKESNKVLWINSDPRKLNGKNAWHSFDETQHKVVYAIHYNPGIQDKFEAALDGDDVAVAFQPKSVYDKKTARERMLQDWNDKLDSEAETEDNPLRDENENIIPHQIHTASGWKLDIVSKKKDMIHDINALCSEKIIYGFLSMALGSSHHYSFDRDDQMNLNGAVFPEVDVPLKCRNGESQKEWKIHTPFQVRQVAKDGAFHKAKLLEFASQLKARVNKIVTVQDFCEIDIHSGWELD
ncbi:hypothetical protein [Leptospira adleri]|uniref:DUF4376 domain-containing protein n=1 Tax=Leptospira adleri TaxID=2023186 RepID=A0A2M9YNM7_9LEPT|nr:hypothetical protein [Leptospira adleri]PJZ53147.1 hypothetical protein CH380_12105 [Leptospira adleri]PJZ62063.1 hypothetical protein CH376_09740 [Leptospira adleri]